MYCAMPLSSTFYIYLMPFDLYLLDVATSKNLITNLLPIYILAYQSSAVVLRAPLPNFSFPKIIQESKYINCLHVKYILELELVPQLHGPKHTDAGCDSCQAELPCEDFVCLRCLSFLAAMSSSSSDNVTQFVRPSVRPSVRVLFFILS